MAPEYTKAAEGLAPLIPLFAVDCDAEKNKRLCGEQGVKGFPTLKLFPRGGRAPPLDYDGGERTARSIHNWAVRKVPNAVGVLKAPAGVPAWLAKVPLRLRSLLPDPDTAQHTDKPRALLLHKDAKPPLLWTVLANAHRGLAFAALPDPDGAHAAALGLSARVVLYAPGGDVPVPYTGTLKHAPLDKYLRDVVRGNVVLGASGTDEAEAPQAEARSKEEL
jgi:protein disulfide-isomerase A6